MITYVPADHAADHAADHTAMGHPLENPGGPA
jgi:hypothetical protein